MDKLFNLVQVLTVSHDIMHGLPVLKCHEECFKKQKLVDVIKNSKEKGLEVRQKIREAIEVK